MGRAKGSGNADEDEESRPAHPLSDQVALRDTQAGAATILPRPMATVISGATGIASLNVRAAMKIGGWTLYASREATLKSLSVARSAAEQVLLLAGRDVAYRTEPGSLGHLEAANTLQSAIHLLHSVLSKASFVASSGFYLTEAIMNSASGVAIHGLAVLNALFGNTETSKAVAAVITLLSTELNRPQGEHVASYWDLFSGLVGFVLLQRWGRRKTMLDFRNEGGEHTIWDTVIDDRGFRADVVGTRRQETVTLRPGHNQPAHSFVSPADDDNPEAVFEALERGTLFDAGQTLELTAEDQARLSDQELRDQIVRQLPPGARAVVTTETFTAKTIKVEIYDADATNIEAPPGTIMPEISDNDEDTVMMRDISKPTPPPKDSSRALQTTDSSSGQSDRRQRTSVLKKRDPVANQKKSRKPAFNLSTSTDDTTPAGPSTSKHVRHSVPIDKQDKEGKIRKAMRNLSPTSSFAAIRDAPSLLPRRRSAEPKQLPTLARLTTIGNDAGQPRVYPPIQGMSAHSSGPTPFGSPGQVASPGQIAASSYFVRETRRNSIVSQTDTYSIHSGGDSRAGSRAASPTFSRTHSRTVNSISHSQSETGASLRASDGHSTVHHQRTRSFQPSLYSMGSKHSGEAVVLAPKMPVPRKSIYEDSNVVDALVRDGKVPGTFPDQHLVRSIRRFARFATASYGSGFLHVMGLNNVGENLSKSTDLVTMDVHQEHSSFSEHTGLPASTIILSSFYDPQGVINSTEWSSAAISPLIHFVSLDEKSKAVVLSVRGTLGFEES
ncbi:uncharacterized protein AB675_2396 [Cyphellophora attinorum]|uniref:Uncharacterized protein n=1 Tax=Cyphellophora attinorum TaxID=1664694 RepID=A0A0N1HHC6_9EURO|nr:uncharacterized protein AB675_2396 [Phialophora attinorum]KPI45346.1 hypothetical protein AB675_2396 [Phialophora attinorum]